jgi:uncharacterized protein (DUF488 family)
MIDTPNSLQSRQPVYKRQQFVLALLKQLNMCVTKTDLQKIVFMYTMRRENGYYDFVPYRFGAFSFLLEQDISVLHNSGFIDDDNKIKNTAYNPVIEINSSFIEKLSGDALIRKSYNLYPYYAINSTIINRILPEPQGQKLVNKIRQDLKKDENRVFSIGYESRSIEAFVNLLLQNDIRVLCDVRRNPLSRKFGFSKSKLQHIVNEVGIQYMHYPELGIASENRQFLTTQDDYDRLFAGYKAELPLKRAGLNKIYELMKAHKRIALMCYELNPKQCHRTVIVNYIKKYYAITSEDI